MEKVKKRIEKAFWDAIASEEKVTIYDISINTLLFKEGFDSDGRKAGLEELLSKVLEAVNETNSLIIEERFSGEMSRKIEKWSEANCIVVNDSKVVKALRDLPFFTVGDLEIINPLDNFNFKEMALKEGLEKEETRIPQWFVLFRELDEMYIVNTEGFDYCRYIVKIKV